MQTKSCHSLIVSQKNPHRGFDKKALLTNDVCLSMNKSAFKKKGQKLWSQHAARPPKYAPKGWWHRSGKNIFPSVKFHHGGTVTTTTPPSRPTALHWLLKVLPVWVLVHNGRQHTYKTKDWASPKHVLMFVQACVSVIGCVWVCACVGGLQKVCLFLAETTTLISLRWWSTASQ